MLKEGYHFVLSTWITSHPAPSVSHSDGWYKHKLNGYHLAQAKMQCLGRRSANLEKPTVSGGNLSLNSWYTSCKLLRTNFFWVCTRCSPCFTETIFPGTILLTSSDSWKPRMRSAVLGAIWGGLDLDRELQRLPSPSQDLSFFELYSLLCQNHSESF